MNHWGSPFDCNANGSLKNPVIIPNKTFFELSDDFTYEYSAVQGSMLKYHDKQILYSLKARAKASEIFAPFATLSIGFISFIRVSGFQTFGENLQGETPNSPMIFFFAGSGVLRFSHLKESCCFVFLKRQFFSESLGRFQG